MMTSLSSPLYSMMKGGSNTVRPADLLMKRYGCDADYITGLCLCSASAKPTFMMRLQAAVFVRSVLIPFMKKGSLSMVSWSFKSSLPIGC